MPTHYNFLPATLKHCNSIGYFVEFYALNNEQTHLKRQVVKLNKLRERYNSLTDFKRQAAIICQDINTKLAGGWSPFMETSNARYYTPLLPLLDDYIAEKSRELRSSTITSYRSFCKMFGEWLAANHPTIRSGHFTRIYAVMYMDFFYQKKITPRTYNNQIKQGRALFSWLVEKCYAKENPFALIKTKKETQKRRVLIPADTRQKIRAYFEKENPYFIAVMQLVFNSLIRPKEIVYLKMKNLDLDHRCINIPSEVAKTHYARIATLSPELLAWFSLPEYQKARPGDFLFGNGYAPSARQIASARFRKDWDKMRKALKLPEEMQLYSLRDTGINTLLKNGVDTLTVMQHADHHDLSITTRYANHADPNLIKKIYENAPTF